MWLYCWIVGFQTIFSDGLHSRWRLQCRGNKHGEVIFIFQLSVVKIRVVFQCFPL